jgi:hypothetical protein
MNRFKKGSDLKLPELKVPAFLSDLYYDLLDRRLLPLVALLLVAIVAAPFLLKGTSDSEVEPSVRIGAGASSASPTSSLVVSKAEPGLRDYRHRLAHLSPTNPFRGQPGNEGSEGSGTGEEGSSSEGEGTTAPTEETPTEGSSGGESAPTETTVQHSVTYFTYAIDVRVTPITDAGGKRSKQRPTVRRDLPPLTMLPGRETPAFTYMGPTKDTKKAVMLVSDSVTGLFGDATCIVGTETCQLLALEPGVPETVAWANSGRSFKIELIKIYVQKTDQLNRAPLGKPKQSKQSSHAG